MASSTQGFFASLGKGQQLEAENRRLKQSEIAIALYQDRIDFLNRHVDGLRKLLDLPPTPGKTRIPALVTSYAPLENRATINRGRTHGIRPQLPVLAGEGLFGIVQTVDAGTAQILLISSPQIRVGAVVNRQPAPYGIIRGESANKMIMDIVGIKATVEPGDVVMTSGLGELVPGGIPIGIISQKESDVEYGALRCQVFPYVSVGEVREVVVLR